LPRQDRLALIMIAGIVLVGFLLEGIRIAMTGYPENSGFAVVGYGIGKLFSGMTGLTEIFGLCLVCPCCFSQGHLSPIYPLVI